MYADFGTKSDDPTYFAQKFEQSKENLRFLSIGCAFACGRTEQTPLSALEVGLLEWYFALDMGCWMSGEDREQKHDLLQKILGPRYMRVQMHIPKSVNHINSLVCETDKMWILARRKIIKFFS